MTNVKPGEMMPRSFWVVEQFLDGKSQGYWDGGNSRSFVSDIDNAIQFCRRSDCFWATRGWHWTDVKLTEHVILLEQSPPVQTSIVQEIKDAIGPNGWQDPYKSPPVQSDESEINSVIRMVQRCLTISNKSPLEFSRRSIEVLVQAAEQRVAPRTGVPEIEKEYDKLREMHERNDLTNWGDGRFHGIKFCYEALTAYNSKKV